MSWKTSSSYRAFIMATDVPLPDQYLRVAFCVLARTFGMVEPGQPGTMVAHYKAV